MEVQSDSGEPQPDCILAALKPEIDFAESNAGRVQNFQPARPTLMDCLPMSDRIRHCVECPRCRTWYIIAFNPYRNGSHLVPTVPGSSEEYTLYCSCVRPAFVSRWRWSDVPTCAVAKAAHDRGYGTPAEIAITNQTRSRRR
jgi:hypothetical protein